MKIRKSAIRTGIIVALLIFFAIFFRYLAVAYKILPTPMGLMRAFIYMALFGGWGVSIRRRIVQRQVQRYLLTVSSLTVFWMAIRTVKFHFVHDPTALRQLWYAYYIPMLFIPLMALFVALSIGKAENYRLPKWTALFYIPTTALVLLVLTNDFHQLVFAFPAGTSVWTDKLYAYNTCYWIIAGWLVLCAAAALTTMLHKCRVPQSHRFIWLPLVPFAVSVLYGMAYVFDLPGLSIIAGDLTAAQCLLFTTVFECCIQSGLIQSNTGYDLLFPASTACMQIVDKNYDVVYSSTADMDIPKAVLRQTANGVVALGRDTLIKGNAIHGGFVIWREDITELVDTIDELRENQEEIAHANDVERENYNTLRLISQLREKNRLYDLVQEQTAKQTILLNDLLDAYYQETDENERRGLLAKAAVLGAYIKRRGNLVLLREQNELMPVAELSLCLNESMQSLSLMGVNCVQTVKLEDGISASSAMRIFDFFEAVVEATLSNLSGIWVHVSQRADYIIARVEAISTVNLSSLACSDVRIAHEDDAWSLALRLYKGGADE